jgi:hypothetical protein
LRQPLIAQLSGRTPNHLARHGSRGGIQLTSRRGNIRLQGEQGSVVELRKVTVIRHDHCGDRHGNSLSS